MIEVDNAVGKVYRKFSPESKKQFDQAVNVMLKKAVNDATLPNYKQMLDEVGAEALKNGLTPDILDELLRSDE